MKLLRAVGGIDEDIIAECAPIGKKKNSRIITRGIMATAACAVLAVGIVSVSMMYSQNKNTPADTFGDLMFPIKNVSGDEMPGFGYSGDGERPEIGPSDNMPQDFNSPAASTDDKEVTEPAVETDVKGSAGTVISGDTTASAETAPDPEGPRAEEPADFPYNFAYGGGSYIIAAAIAPDMCSEVLHASGDEYDVEIHAINGVSEAYAVAVKSGSEYWMYVNTMYVPATLGDFIDDLGMRDQLSIGDYYYRHGLKTQYSGIVQFIGAGADKLWNTVFAKTAAPRHDGPIDGTVWVTLRFYTQLNEKIRAGVLNHSITVTKDGYLCVDIFAGDAILSYKFDVGTDAAQSLVDALLEGYSNREYEGYELNDVTNEEPTEFGIVVEDTYGNIETYVMPGKGDYADGDVVNTPPYDPPK